MAITPSATTITTTMNQNMNKTIRSFNHESHDLKKKYKEDQLRINEKYKENMYSINTCVKTASSICNVLNKMKMQINYNDYEEDIQQLTNQAESSCSNHSNSLEQLKNKQNETLNKAFENLFKDHND